MAEHEHSDVDRAVDRVLDFAEFYLRLGEMKSPDMLIAIETRDPEFADYFATVTEPIGSAADFFRIYVDWALSRIRKECVSEWREVQEACAACERYRILEMQCKGQTLMWEDMAKLVGGNG